MGKAALFAIAAFALMGAYYAMSTQRGGIETDARLAEHQFDVLARNAAMSGYMKMRQAIADAEDFNVSSIQGEFAGASYSAQVTTSGVDRGIISATGTMNGRGGVHEYRIRAEVEREAHIEEVDEVPVFMRYGMASNGDLNVSGSVLIDTLRVEGNDDNLMNANLHTNGRLSTRGNSALIRGFGTYVTSHDVGHTKVFQPYYNPTNEPVLQKVNPIHIPQGFDAQKMASDMGYDQYEGSGYVLPASLDVSGGDNSADNPYVVFVNGALAVPPGAQIKGHAIFLVEGNIELQGGVGIGTTEPKSETTVGFYASNDVTIGGNASSIWGTIVAGHNVKFNGTPTIFGGVAIGNIAEIVGTPTIKYVPPPPGLARPFVDPNVSLTMISYNEW